MFHSGGMLLKATQPARKFCNGVAGRYAHTLVATDPKFILNHFVVQSRQQMGIQGAKPFVKVEVSDELFQDLQNGKVKEGRNENESGPSSHWKVGRTAIEGEERIIDYSLQGIHDCESGYTCLIEQRTAEEAVEKIRELTPESDDVEDHAAEEMSVVKACERSWEQFLEAMNKRSKESHHPVIKLEQEFSPFLFIGHLGPAGDMNSVAVFGKGSNVQNSGLLLYSHNAKERDDDMF